jgi:hypothetical protein
LILALPAGREFGREFPIFQPFLAFPMSIRTAISARRTQILCPAGAGNFLRQRRELTCQGREFAIFGEFAPKN